MYAVIHGVACRCAKLWSTYARWSYMLMRDGPDADPTAPTLETSRWER